MNTIQTPLYKEAFGSDFDLGIDLPGSFTDISYSNDACPSFEFKSALFPAYTVKLWVDFEDSDQREAPEDFRYSVDISNDKETIKAFDDNDPKKLCDFLNNILLLLSEYNAIDSKPSQCDLDDTLIESAKKGFAEWYIFRQLSSIRMATVLLWLEANHPEHKDDNGLLWHIIDGYSEYLPESYYE